MAKTKKSLRIKRGLEANLPHLLEGEPSYNTDTQELIIGNNSDENTKFLNKSDFLSQSEIVSENLNKKIKDVSDDVNRKIKKVNFYTKKIISDSLLYQCIAPFSRSKDISEIYNSEEIIYIYADIFIQRNRNKILYLLGLKTFPNFYVSIAKDNFDGMWSKLFIKIQKNEMACFINGEKVSIDNRQYDNAGLVIGHYYTPNIEFQAIIKNLLIYNRKLTESEIKYNEDILLGKYDINKANLNEKDYKLTIDSNQLIMSNQANLEDAYTGLYETNAQEFVSADGSDIMINNAIKDSKMLSCEMQGRTARNYFGQNELTSGSFAVLNNGWVDVNLIPGNHYVDLQIKNMANRITPKPSTRYTLYYELKNVSNPEGVGNRVTVGFAASRHPYVYDIPGAEQHMTNGKHTLVFTTPATIDPTHIGFGLRVFAQGIGTQARTCNFRLFGIVEESSGVVLDTCLDTGLHSTKAIMSNNGLEYKFYEPNIYGETKLVDSNGNECVPGTTGAKFEYVKPSDPSLPILCSAGALTDSLDLSTGILTKKAMVYNPTTYTGTMTRQWTLDVDKGTSYARFYGLPSIFLYGTTARKDIMCTHLKTSIDTNNLWANPTQAFVCTVGNIGISIPKSELSTVDVPGLMKWFSDRKVEFIFEANTQNTTTLTKEQLKAYEPYKKIARLNKVGNGLDIIKNNIYYQDVEEKVLNRFVNISEIIEKTNVVQMNITRENVSQENNISIICDKLQIGEPFIGANEHVSICTYKGIIVINAPKSELREVSKAACSEWLDDKMLKVVFKKQTPSQITLHNSIIHISESNNISVGGDIKPSSYKITVPVNKQLTIEEKLAQLESGAQAIATLATEV